MKLILSVAVLVFALSFAYYLVVFLPQKDAANRKAFELKQRVIISCEQFVSTAQMPPSATLNEIKTFQEMTYTLCLHKNGY